MSRYITKNYILCLIFYDLIKFIFTCSNHFIKVCRKLISRIAELSLSKFLSLHVSDIVSKNNKKLENKII